MTRFRSALLAATLLAGAGAIGLAATAHAQPAPVYDPQQLPATKGKVAQYSLTPRGDVDGLILTDGTEVHLPPRLSTQLVFSVKPGDGVTVHGLKARAVPMVQAMSITNDATGQTVTDSGPAAGMMGGMGGMGGMMAGPMGGPDMRKMHEAHGMGPHGMGPHGMMEMGAPLDGQGKIKSQLHSPRGDVNGVLLEDGTIVRLPPPVATRMASELAPGQPLYVSGPGSASALGKVIMAREIGPTKDKATTIAAPWMHRGGKEGPEKGMPHAMPDVHPPMTGKPAAQ